MDGKAGEQVLLEDGAGEDVMFVVRGRASITRRGVEVSTGLWFFVPTQFVFLLYRCNSYPTLIQIVCPRKRYRYVLLTWYQSVPQYKEYLD